MSLIWASWTVLWIKLDHSTLSSRGRLRISPQSKPTPAQHPEHSAISKNQYNCSSLEQGQKETSLAKPSAFWKPPLYWWKEKLRICRTNKIVTRNLGLGLPHFLGLSCPPVAISPPSHPQNMSHLRSRWDDQVGSLPTAAVCRSVAQRRTRSIKVF